VVFRLLGRLVYMHNAGLDDLFIVISLVGNPSAPSMPTLTIFAGLPDGVHIHHSCRLVPNHAAGAIHVRALHPGPNLTL
jgi:hypothetical protein